jgi:hypothetical protein
MPITPKEALSALHTGTWGDETVLKIVVQDSERAENFQANKSWVQAWNVATTLYQSPVTPRYWEGTQAERANMPDFTVAKACRSLVPQIMNGLFYDDPPFMWEERENTPEIAARAAADIIGYQLGEIGFRKELELGVNNAVLFGTGIWTWGWDTFTKTRKYYKRKGEGFNVPGPVGDTFIEPDDDDIEYEEVEEQIDQPKFEHIVNLRHVLVDPGLNVPDIRKAKYVIHRRYMTWEQLDKLRDRPGFNIPSREEMLMLFLPPKEPVEANPAEQGVRTPLWDARAEARFEETTIDPFNQPLEVLERWSEKQYMVVLQKKAVLCNDANPYGVIPFLSVGWWDVPEAFWSMGLAKTVGPNQRLQQGVKNTWLDNAALALNGVYVRVMGKSVATQNIRIAPGKIVNVENKGDFEPLKRLDPVPEAMQILTMNEANAEDISGAGVGATGGTGGKVGVFRTAAGANLAGAGTSSRVQDFVEKLADQVIVPFLYHAHEMNCSLLPIKTMKAILNDELQHEFMKRRGNILEILNARLYFDVGAAARLQARRNMAQSLPILMQWLLNPQTSNSLAIQKKKVDTNEVLRMLFTVADWKNQKDVIVDMTDEDFQNWQSMQPGAKAKVDAQAKAAAQSQKEAHETQLADSENIARAGREVLRAALEKPAEAEVLAGEPAATTGFGTQV